MSTTIFQFHKGAIRTTNMGIVEYRCANFNSIKVRLERAFPYPVRQTGKRFQFHKGAIRTLQINSFITCFSYFNSIKVRLERAPPHRWRFCCLDFNSIKVRLEQSKRVELLIVLVFQFHKGAIRTYLGNYPRTFFVISIP